MDLAALYIILQIVFIECLNVATTKAKVSDSIRLIFGGDLYLGGIVQKHVELGDCTYNDSFNKIRKIFKQEADHVIVNFESPLVDKAPQASINKTVNLYTLREAVSSLKYGGIDSVVLGNNHLLDYGPKHVESTVSILEKANISYSGVRHTDNLFGEQKAILIKKNGMNIAVLSYCYIGECKSKGSPGPAAYSLATAIRDVSKLRKEGAGVIIAYLHWGDEYRVLQDCRTRIVVKELSSYVNSIIGSHPHVKQGHYYYNNTLVVPSLGNFIFPMHLTMHYMLQVVGVKFDKRYDDNWYELSTKFMNPTSYGKIVRLTVKKSGIVSADYLPTQIKPNKNHCLQVSKEDNKDWMDICSKHDRECLGTSECNLISCHGVGMSETDDICEAMAPI